MTTHLIACDLQPISPPPVLSRSETLSLHLNKLTPFRIIRIYDRTVYEFWTIGCKPEVGMTNALSDPKIARQMAYIVAFRDKDTFQIGYHRGGEESQTVCDLPLSRLGEAVDDLRAAGF